MEVKMGNTANIPVDAYNTRWTEANRASAKWPKAVNSYERTMLISNRYVEDGSYLKLKNLSIGYSLKVSVLSIFMEMLPTCLPLPDIVGLTLK